ncbi:MAG: glycosyltransferase family 9 protein [Acidobacteria bacterium]|nr:glycosyltransferase family 9 protein [Acidobacteriota bacterium]
MRAHAACAGSLPFELPEGRLAVFAPGANEEQRRFSAAPTLQVFSQFAGMGLNVVLVGAPADRPLASSLAAAASVPVADLTGRTGVQELAEILRRAEIVVTEDSGPAHIAAALRRPPAGLYGASLAPLTTAPWGAGHLVLVAGAMEAFSSELVMAAIRTRLGMAADAELRPEALRATAQVWRTAMLTGGADPLRISGPVTATIGDLRQRAADHPAIAPAILFLDWKLRMMPPYGSVACFRKTSANSNGPPTRRGWSGRPPRNSGLWRMNVGLVTSTSSGSQSRNKKGFYFFAVAPRTPSRKAVSVSSSASLATESAMPLIFPKDKKLKKPSHEPSDRLRPTDSHSTTTPPSRSLKRQ